MSTNNERIHIQVSEQGAKVVARSIREVGMSARAVTPLLNQLRTALGVSIAVKLADDYMVLQNRLRATGLEGERLSAVYKQLLAVSNETRTSVDATATIYSRLIFSSRELGISQQQAMQFTKALNHAVSLSGTTAQEARAGLIQFSQGLAAGKLRGDELRSVLEQMPIVADTIADHFNISRGDLLKFGEAGKLTATDIIQAFQEAAPELERRFAQMQPTIGQGFVILKNQAMDFIGSLNSGIGIADALAASLVFLGNNLATLASLLATGGAAWVAYKLKAIEATSFTRFFKTSMQTEVIETLVDVTDEFGFTTREMQKMELVVGKSTFGTRLKSMFLAAANGVKSFTLALLANPFTFFITMLTIAIGLTVAFKDKLKLAGDDGVATMGDWFGVVGPKIVDTLKDIASWAKYLAETAFKAMGINAEINFKSILGFFAAMVDGFIGGVNAIKRITKDILSGNFGMDTLRGAKGDLFGTTTTQDALQATFDQAEKNAKARIEAEEKAKKDAATVTPVEDKVTGFDPKDIEKSREAMQGLIASYDSVYAAQLKLAEAGTILAEARRMGIITEEEEINQMMRIKDALTAELEPYKAVMAELDEQERLLRMSNEQREIEIQLKRLLEDLQLEPGNPEALALREKLELLQKIAEQEGLKKELKDVARENATGSADAISADVEALNKLVGMGEAEGGMDEADALSVMRSRYDELFASITSGWDLAVEKHKQAYAEIDATSAANFLSEQQRNQMRAAADSQLLQVKLQTYSNYFGQLTALSSSSNKTMARIGKAATIAQATIDGLGAIQKAYNSGTFPANLASVALVTVMQAANLAAIVSTNIDGFAHGGDFTVGGVGGTDSQNIAFRATPGEEVSIRTPSQAREEARQAETAAPRSEIRVVNLVDSSLLADYLGTPEGEEVLVNTIRRNQDAVRSAVG